MRAPLASSGAGDEIGDLSRSFGSVLARLSEYASYQEKMASRLSHELRTPIAVVRSSLDNLKACVAARTMLASTWRARSEGLARLTQILTRMTEAARLEQSLSDVERVRFDVVPVVTGCVDGFRLAYPTRASRTTRRRSRSSSTGAPDLVAQMLDKLVANAVEFAAGGAIDVRLCARRVRRAHRRSPTTARCCPEGMEDACSSRWCRCARGRRDGAAPGTRALHRARHRAVPPRRRRAAANKPDGSRRRDHGDAAAGAEPSPVVPHGAETSFTIGASNSTSTLGPPAAVLSNLSVPASFFASSVFAASEAVGSVPEYWIFCPFMTIQ